MNQENELNAEKAMDDFEDIRIEEQEKTEDQHDMKDKKDKKKHKKDKLSEELEQLQLKFDELNDKYLRLFSEFDNYRKRTLKEKVELNKTASEEVMLILLPILDDFERAIQNLPKDEALSSQLEGVMLIQNKLLKALEQKGLSMIDARNQEFDTDFHEAITHIPAPDPSLFGKVVDVIQNGYTLNGKVIRFAKVVTGS